MKEDNSSQLDDYDPPFCEQQYTYGSCCISLFKFRSFDQFNTLQTAAGSLSKLTRWRPTSKSIQIQSDGCQGPTDGCQGPTEFTWP